jgi:hypothetical protein
MQNKQRFLRKYAVCAAALLSLAALSCIEEAGIPYIMVSKKPASAGYHVGDVITVAIKNGTSYHDFRWYYSLTNPPALELSKTLEAYGDNKDTFTISSVFGTNNNSSVGGYIKIACPLTKESEIIETEWLGPIAASP